jgi:membrane protease YdiL (CAAX protease family)
MYNRQERIRPELILILYLFVVVISLFCYFYPIPFYEWGAGYIIAAVMILFAFFIYRKNFSVFVSILFFVLLYFSYPLIRVQEALIPLHFPGVLFAIPVIAYIVIILFSRKCRGEVSWLARGSFDRISVLLILGIIVISGVALIGWTILLSPILSTMPRVHPGLLILGGFGFALSNALVEELIFRGILWDGLRSLLTSTAAVIIIQSALFGILHWKGFPSGVVGVSLVFIWGILLGIIRQRTRGLLAPILAHIGADLTIFGILLMMVQK